MSDNWIWTIIEQPPVVNDFGPGRVFKHYHGEESHWEESVHVSFPVGLFIMNR